MKFGKSLILTALIVLASGCGAGGLFNGSFFNHGGGGGGGGGGTTNFAAVYTSNSPSNPSNDIITIYPLNGGSDPTPSRSYQGCTCHLDHPAQTGVDAQGNLYIINQGVLGTTSPSVVVFSPSTDGNTTPIRTITSPVLVSPQALAIDGSGNIFVGDAGSSAIYEFTSSQNGPSAPVNVITSNVQQPLALAVAPNGDLYAADYGAKAVLIYAAGTLAFKGEINGSNTGLASGPSGIAFDSAGNIYVTTKDNGAIVEFPAGTQTNIVPSRTITGLTSPQGIGVDASGNMYVGQSSANQINVYSASTPSGTSSPSSTISGSNTKLNAPTYVSI